MNILVTGGSGFIGSNFLAAVVPRNPQHTFINFDKLTYAARPRSPLLASLASCDNYRFERGDIVDRDTVANIFRSWPPDAVVHFAAETHVDRSIGGPDMFLRTNVMGTAVLLDACRWLASNAVFHHVSTDEVYGSLGLEDAAFTEETRYDPSSPYSATKAASDHLVRAWGRTYGLPFKVTNCSNNYGPGQHPEKLIPRMILNALEGRPLPIYGNGQNVRDWLFVADHCEAIWSVLWEGRVGETYNIGGRTELSNIEVVDKVCAAVAEVTGKDLESLLALKTFVPDRPGHDLRYAIDSSKIERELAWTPDETFDSGLRKTVAWYVEHGGW